MTHRNKQRRSLNQGNSGPTETHRIEAEYVRESGIYQTQLEKAPKQGLPYAQQEVE